VREGAPAVTAPAESNDYDVIVVGSGFGGAVAALRLSEKGYRVAVVEAGRRWDATSLPRTSWDVRRFLWAPLLGCFGIQRVHLLRDVVVLAGAGVGGGSLNYANTSYEPGRAFYEDPQWSALADWGAELAPYYDQARRVLGVADNPTMTPADEAMLAVAGEMGVASTFRLAPVAVTFGPPGTAPGTDVGDPYFGGAGPARRSCRQCGECMTGCRHGAKNTLVTNYLHLAERAGAVIIPMTTVRSVEPDQNGWAVGTTRTGWAGAWRPPRLMRADQVVLAAGAFGTQKLLHTMARQGKLPALSPRLGWLTRTNSESLLGAVVPSRRTHPDFARGVAITSSFRPEPETHVEPVRYGRGSNLMGIFGTLLVGDDERVAVEGSGPQAGPSWRRLVTVGARHPVQFGRQFDLRHWSERSVIALVMQARDNSLTLSAGRGLLGRSRLRSRPGHGQPHPAWLPVGHLVARRLAARVGGQAQGTWGEVFGVPMTAHFLGGCVIGASPAQGVIDRWHRAFGYPTLHVVDGSAVPANPGVNPSLTITALAERAFAYWPNRGGADPRPVPGQLDEPTTAVAVVAPHHPAVPSGAVGELRLPVRAAPGRGPAGTAATGG
jgi:cholesterol oxidase